MRDELQRQFGVALHERSVGKVLKRLGYSPAFGAPAPPAAVVFDGAGYHIAKDLAVREKITLSATSRAWSLPTYP